MQRIFVGDIQGCADEFDELLARAQSQFGNRFELWVVGDVVNRGPGNVRALSRVRELVDAGRARYVLGNHELGLLQVALGLRELKSRDTYGELAQGPDAADWVDWLSRRSVVETGQLGRQPFAMVHASVHPDWSYDELQGWARRVEDRLQRGGPNELRRFLAADLADPERDALARFTRCRSVRADASWSSLEPVPGMRPWHEAWVGRGHGYGIVYGHWAMQGLHVAPWLRGLDTGCVHHGRGHDGMLTAWLPDPNDPTPFNVGSDARLWQIPARRAYYADGTPA